MAKVQVFCKVKRKLVKMDKRLADALVKMNRASYDTKVETVYPNKMMVSDTNKIIEEKPKKTRARKKKQEEVKEDVQAQIEELNKLFVPEDNVDNTVNQEVSKEVDKVSEEVSNEVDTVDQETVNTDIDANK